MTLFVAIMTMHFSYYQNTWELTNTLVFIGKCSSVIAILALIILCSISLLILGLPKQLALPILLIILLMSFAIFHLIRFPEDTFSINSIAQLLSISLTLITFYFLGKKRWFNSQKKYYFRIVIFYLLLLLIQVFYAPEASNNISKQGLFGNPNTLGAFVVTIYPLALMLSKKKDFIFLFIICFLLILLSLSRTSLLAFTAFNILYLTRPLWQSKKTRFIIVLLTLNILSIGIIYIIILPNLSDFNVAIGHKPLSSGRESLWPIAIKLILEKPWLGWGPGIPLSQISALTLNPHNQYLYILLQYGVIGFTLFISIIYSLALAIYHIPLLTRSRGLALASFSIILIVMNFEDSYFQGSLLVQLPFWCALGLALGQNISTQNYK